MDIDTLTFGSRLAAARRNAGLTQEQLGKGLGPDGSDLGKGAISSWEVNRTEPSAAQLRLLCERLNVSANDLLDVSRSSWDGVERRSATRAVG